MKYIDRFRNPEVVPALRKRIHEKALRLSKQEERTRLMEVCGSHSMAIARFGIRSLLPENIELISGPGCPVCVTEPGFIDTALTLAARGIKIATFGDMMRVPGSTTTLTEARSQGADITVCYSPLEVLGEKKTTVFLAVGFETTLAPFSVLIKKLTQEKIEHISLLTAFKQIPPALNLLVEDPKLAIDGLIAPAHVSAIIGADIYKPLAARYQLPTVIAGFEPLDILFAIDGLLSQRLNNTPKIENQYARVVKSKGNLKARQQIDAFFAPSDAFWRGLGIIPKSGLKLRRSFSYWDACDQHQIKITSGEVHPGCRCGDVLKGMLSPPLCPLWKNPCTPDHPLGPCMVSSEGSCAAHYLYEGLS
ncbi:hydrogenase formation protein HypD [Magnetococcales bacterium HHB-1]